MNKIRITHKDGDMQGITLMYLINKYLKINRKLWDKDNMVLNRYYKAILTRTIKVSDKIVDKFKKYINYKAEKEIKKVLEEGYVFFETYDKYGETNKEVHFGKYVVEDEYSEYRVFDEDEFKELYDEVK